MDNIYTTIQGDTWDIVSLKVYGTDKMAHKIIDANEKLCNIVYFSAGIELLIPKLLKKINSNLPPWRR